jgi:hypothetical protein
MEKERSHYWGNSLYNITVYKPKADELYAYFALAFSAIKKQAGEQLTSGKIYAVIVPRY